MISYDQYENKIKKYAKFKNFMKRYKFLFIGIFALIIAAIATLLGVKGSFSGTIKIADSIYGETYSDPEGVSAFMSSVSYEYAQKGSNDWSEEKPVKAGEYSVRAVANKTIGKGYGKVTFFKIEKREVEFSIKSDSVVYGSVPKDISLMTLVSGDKLDDERALLFKYDDYTASRTNVDLDVSSVKIMNGTDDRTDCYTVLHEKKELKIDPREISVSLDKVDFVYSGSAISYPAAASYDTKLQLANGDIIEFDETKIEIKQGSMDIKALFAGDYSALAGDFKIYKVVDGESEPIDVTRQYWVTSSEPVNFIIKPRPVRVQTAPGEKVYDGTPLTALNGYEVMPGLLDDEGLLDGDKLTALESTSIVNVDSVNNEITKYEIRNKENVDLTDNYVVISEGGKLTVTPRAITVTSPSHEAWEYDGKEHSYIGISCTDTLFTVTANWSKAVVDAGEYANEVDFTIWKDDAEVSKSNFLIKTEWGTLTVTPIHITLITRSAQFVYDGKLHSAADDYTVFVGETKTALIEGNTLIVDSDTTLRDVSKAENRCVYSVSTNNYVIDEVTYGTIEVIPRTLIVETNSNSFVYNGTARSDASYLTRHIGEDGIVEDGLIGEDELIATFAPSVTYVSNIKTENRCEYKVPNANYEIVDYVYGTLEVTPRPITVITATDTHVYDGKPFSNDTYTTYHIDEEGRRQGGLLNGDKLVLQKRCEITNVDDSGKNRCVFSVPNENYSLAEYDYEYGTLTITPRPITVVTRDATKVYDGTPLWNDQYTTYYINQEGQRQGGLLNGDELILQKRCEITNVDDSGENRCVFSVPNGNYSLAEYDYEYGTLTITPKTVVVKALDATSIYGEDYKEAKYPTEAGNYQSDDGFIGEDETVKLTVEFDLSAYRSEIKDMSRVPVRWIDGEICGYEGAVKIVSYEFIGGDSKNYNIVTKDGNGALYIERRVLCVAMSSVTTFYGEELYKGEEVAEGIRASAVYPEGKGNVEGVYPVSKGNVDGVDTKKVEYDKNGLLEGDEIEVKYLHYLTIPSNSNSDKEQDWENAYTDPKDANRYYIKPYEIWIYPKDGKTEKTTDGDEGDCEGNYLIEYYNPGVLKIKPRPIEVTLNEIAEKCYDGEVCTYKAGGEGITLLRDSVGENEILKNFDMVLAYGERLSVEVIFDKLPKYAGKYSYTLDKENSVIINKDGSPSDLSNYAITCKNDTLTIKKRPITLKLHDLTFIYGDDIDYSDYNNFYDITSELGFVTGDIIDAILIDFGYEYGKKANVGVYTISVTGAIIKNDDGLELDGSTFVTNSYDIKWIEAKLTINKKPIDVTVYPTSLTYGDKIILNRPTISLSELPYDEEMTFDFAYLQGGKPTPARNVGSYDVKAIPKIDGKEEGVNNYEISYFDEEGNSLNNATLEKGLVIEKLPIRVTVENQESIYGDKLEDIKLILDTPIPYEDDTLTFTAVYQKQDGTKVITPMYFGEYVIRVEELRINDEVVFIYGGEEIESNYEFSYENDGILTIDKLEVKVKFKQLNVYYGDPVKYGMGETIYEFEEGYALAYQDKLFLTPVFVLENTNADRPDRGTYTITEDESKRSVLNGEDKATDGGYTIAESYIITVGDSDLIVNKRKISVTLNSIPNDFYDGRAHEYVAGKEIIGGMGMASGETLDVKVTYYSVVDGVRVGTVDAIGKAGSYGYELDSVNSTVIGGNGKLDNYEIASASRTCVIAKRSIEVELLNIEEQTYGTYVTYPSGLGNYNKINAVLPKDGGLVDGEELEIFVEFHAVDWSMSSVNGARLPAGDYVVHAIGASVEGDGDFTDINNYEIEFADKSFKVKQKKITVTLNDLTVDYGEDVDYEIKAGNYKEIGGEGLADDETLTVTKVYIDLPDYAPVEKYDIKLVKVEIVRNDSGQDVTDSYEIEGVDGTFTIEARQILVKTRSYDFVYDGDPHDTRELSDSYKIEYVKDPEKGLAYKDISGYKDEGSLPFVIEYRADATLNKFEIVIMRDGKDVSGNYDIDYKYGNLSIEKRQLYVTTMSAEKVYDGTPLTVPKDIQECYSYLKNDPSLGRTEGLVKGHVFTFKEGAVTITEAESVPNDTIDDIVVSKTSTESKMFNYEIVSSTLGTLTITPRQIYVDWSYNGKDVYDEWVYNGTVHTSPDGGIYTVSYLNDKTGMWETGEGNVLVERHIFKTKTVSVTNAGTFDNNKYIGVEDKESGDDKSSNYKIISRSGKLVVNPRPVSVSTDSYQMTYCKQGPQVSIGYNVQYGDETESEGILNSEKIKINVIYEKDGKRITRFDAGKYQIRLEFLNNGGNFKNENYKFEYVEQGILKIDPVQLTLQPKSKTALYGTVDSIETTAAEVEIIRFLADGTTSNKLVTGDDLTSVTLKDTTLLPSANKSSLSIRIVKGSVIIQDAEGEDTTNNYDIVLARGSLQFIKRTIYYKQIVPEDIRVGGTDRGVVSYKGATQEITAFNGKPLFEVLDYDDARAAGYEGDEYEYGFAEGDEAAVKSASVKKQIKIYEKWVTLNVENGEGLRTQLYDIRMTTYFGDTSIEVKQAQVSVNLNLSLELTEAIQNGTLSEGITRLDSDYAEISSEEDFWANSGYHWEMALCREGNTYTVYVFIYELSSSGRKTDRSSNFTVSNQSGIEGVGLMLVGMEYYPTGD